ncbi:MAG: hypothetical protein LUG46_01410 [Erysipelotrichaceae bacterium]|nr:hypothetical protein [Erysipelotrichaceae bacterium]
MLYFVMGIVIFVMRYVIVSFKFKNKKKSHRNHHYSVFTRQHIVESHDYYQTLNQQMLQNMQMQQAEMARLMATGIEFGGLNSDINLNPGQQMQQQMMNQMNNFGGPGMF